MTLREQFKREHPETIGETDKRFDDYNYIEWLEKKLEQQTPVSGSVSNLPNVDSSQVIPSNPRFIKESKSK